ncbi:cytochrome c [Candidimonas sp. SYP-B2681]|uniref:c-type cytochrome n=1 Tax=Candidimonas sp. SYP-B2681 TaxID=2497686 RepID=UPI0011CF0755|nr:cytochrome c [Candidimonas sp. SYP-B2681]
MGGSINTKIGIGAAGAVVAAAVVFVYSVWIDSGLAFIDPSDQGLVMQGEQIYANHCASCHGAQMQGQPNWRERMSNGRLPAPPHDKTGHTWHHPDAVLIDLVKNGLVPGRTAPSGYESDMPAYGNILSDDEIIAVLAYIKSSWPPKVLDAQKEVTRQQIGQ